jgi:3-dehydroquinate dehydratase-2
MAGILILHGPNLNLIGQREPDIYGSLTLTDIDQKLKTHGKDMGLDVRTFQSNREGDLIDALHEAQDWASGVVFNPGGYTHTSVALRDAVVGISQPVIEVHISNVYAREEFRRKSFISPVSAGKITGFGWRSYLLALQALAWMIEEENK